VTADKPLKDQLVEMLRTLVVVGIILSCIFGVADGYKFFDRQGWITHSKDTPVSGKDWWVGEYRPCVLITNLNVGTDMKAKYLDCPKGSDDSPASADLVRDPYSLPGRVMPVKYHGRIDRKATFIQ
jgi:hypothetical protein